MYGHLGDMTRLEWIALTFFSAGVGTLFTAPVSVPIALSISVGSVHPAFLLAAVSLLLILTRYATGAADSHLLCSAWCTAAGANGALIVAWIRDGLPLDLLVPTPAEVALAVGVAGLATALLQLGDVIVRERAWRRTDWRAMADEESCDTELPHELVAAGSWLELHRERDWRRNPLARMEVDCLRMAEQLWNEFAEHEPDLLDDLAREWNRTPNFTEEPPGSALLTARAGDSTTLRCIWLERALQTARSRVTD